MSDENSLTVGAAAVEIPLELPVDLAGYALRTEQARAIHDPLHVRTIVLRTPAAAIALVVLDLLYVPAQVATIVRDATAEGADVDPAAIMVAATHTHCAPADLATTDVMSAGLVSASREAARRARQGAEPARLAVAVRPVAGVSANRRYLGGKVDRDAWILVAQAASDPPRTIATIVNFPCHATVLGPDWRDVSADFPGVACATIERVVGGTATYLQGFAGDVNPARAGRGWPECARIGTIVGSTVAATVLQAQGLFAGLRAESPTYQAEFDVIVGSGMRRGAAPALRPVGVGGRPAGEWATQPNGRRCAGHGSRGVGNVDRRTAQRPAEPLRCVRSGATRGDPDPTPHPGRRPAISSACQASRSEQPPRAFAGTHRGTC